MHMEALAVSHCLLKSLSLLCLMPTAQLQPLQHELLSRSVSVPYSQTCFLLMLPACSKLTSLILLPIPSVPAANYLTGVIPVLLQLVLHLSPMIKRKKEVELTLLLPPWSLYRILIKGVLLEISRFKSRHPLFKSINIAK